ncbi:MAG: hypothetical protein ACFWT0_04320 [Bifidobacterium crudilactis]
MSSMLIYAWLVISHQNSALLQDQIRVLGRECIAALLVVDPTMMLMLRIVSWIFWMLV